MNGIPLFLLFNLVFLPNLTTCVTYKPCELSRNIYDILALEYGEDEYFKHNFQTIRLMVFIAAYHDFDTSSVVLTDDGVVREGIFGLVQPSTEFFESKHYNFTDGSIDDDVWFFVEHVLFVDRERSIGNHEVRKFFDSICVRSASNIDVYCPLTDFPISLPKNKDLLYKKCHKSLNGTDKRLHCSIPKSKIHKKPNDTRYLDCFTPPKTKKFQPTPMPGVAQQQLEDYMDTTIEPDFDDIYPMPALNSLSSEPTSTSSYFETIDDQINQSTSSFEVVTESWPGINDTRSSSSPELNETKTTYREHPENVMLARLKVKLVSPRFAEKTKISSTKRPRDEAPSAIFLTHVDGTGDLTKDDTVNTNSLTGVDGSQSIPMSSSTSKTASLLEGSTGIAVESDYNVLDASAGANAADASSGARVTDALSRANAMDASRANAEDSLPGAQVMADSSGSNTMDASSRANAMDSSSGAQVMNASSGSNTMDASSRAKAMDSSSGAQVMDASSESNAMDASSRANAMDASSRANAVDASSGSHATDVSRANATDPSPGANTALFPEPNLVEPLPEANATINVPLQREVAMTSSPQLNITHAELLEGINATNTLIGLMQLMLQRMMPINSTSIKQRMSIT